MHVHLREFLYPDGHRCTLELLVPPGSDPVAAGQAVDILYDGILWIWLFTGPEMYTIPDLPEETLVPGPGGSPASPWQGR